MPTAGTGPTAREQCGRRERCAVRPMLIDTHCHFNHAAFDAGRAVVIGYNLASSEWATRLAEGFEGVYAVVGIHPNDAAEATAEGLRQLEVLAGHPRVVAIGEIGLDFHWNVEPPEGQHAAFRE